MRKYRSLTAKEYLTAWLFVGSFTGFILIGWITRMEPLGFAVMASAALLLLVRWHSINFAYRCRECANKFEVSSLENLLSPNMITTKYLRCPKCGTRGWASVLKKIGALD